MSTTTATGTQERQQGLPTGTWGLDAVHSQVGFAVDYIGGTFRGSFSPAESRLEVGEDGSATLTGAVPVAGVKVQDENLVAHLQAPDFFDAERTPDIRFSSTEIRRSGDEITIAGEITIKGITLPVEARGTVTDPAEDPYGGVRFSVKLDATIDRTKFGLNWNNPLPNGQPSLANDVTLTADLYLVKA
jgi:polyisoprenoid-binding protein YceI